MSDLNHFRNQIDEQDQIIMKALEKRMEIAHQIGKYKRQHQLGVTNSKREQEILKTCENFQYSSYLKAIYHTIFSESKRLQSQVFGLIGKNIGYSLSPKLHSEIANLDYEIVDTDQFEDFLKAKNFTGLNVTIPYKTKSFEMVEEVSPEAQKTQVVNTIINHRGHLKGYNTDYLAFERLLKTFKVKVNNKKILIIGNGATSRTVRAVLEKHHPRVITNLVRTIRQENEALISQYHEFSDYHFVINTTPYGSVPNLMDKPLFDLTNFLELEYVIDVIYQPLNSPLLQAAKKITDCKMINGLYMLITQAVFTDELFLEKEIDKRIIEQLYQKYAHELPNIVLIGMPYSGKTTLGNIVSKLTNRELLDTDEILKERGQDLNTVLQKGGSVHQFRAFESSLIKELACMQNKVIATGGGAILNPQNVAYLKANSVIIWLSPSFETLVKRFDGSRPLAQNIDELENLYLERLNYYLEAQDIMVHNNNEPENDAKNILEKYYEYLNN